MNIPHMLIVGDNELENETVSVRLRTDDDLGEMPLTAYIAMVRDLIDSHSLELAQEAAEA